MSSAKHASAGVGHRIGWVARISRSQIGARCGWLGRPWFFAAVTLLALNDQVFKGAWPSWVTGKLSDFAGLVIVATLVSVLVGPALGSALAGVGFVALKTVPGIAELVSPLLGGTTLRDAHDLLALLVLPLVHRTLGLQRRDQGMRSRRGWQIVGLIAAVAATSATSAPVVDSVDWVTFDGGGALAVVRLDNHQTSVYLRSRDDGRTWTEEASYYLLEPTLVPSFDEACSWERTCYRSKKLDRHVLERREGKGKWRSFAEFDNTVSGVLVDPSDGGRVAVTLWKEEVAVRTSAGTWQVTNLVALARQLRPKPDPWASQRSAAMVLGGLVLGFGVFVGILMAVQRRRTARQALDGAPE